MNLRRCSWPFLAAGKFTREYIDGTVPAMAFGEFWDTCEYTDGVLNYNQVPFRCADYRRLEAAASSQVFTHLCRFMALFSLELNMCSRCCSRFEDLELPVSFKKGLGAVQRMGCVPGTQDAHRQRTVSWCDQTGGTAAAFDFTLKGVKAAATQDPRP